MVTHNPKKVLSIRISYFQGQSSWGLALITFLAILLSACDGFQLSDVPTPLPEEYVPTVIALTAQAGQPPEPTPGALPTLATPEFVAALETPAELPTAVTPTDLPASPTLASPVPSETPAATIPIVVNAIPTAVPGPWIPEEVPENRIEIRNLGPLSKVASPLHVYGYLKTGAGSKARIELLGEDHRLIFGETKIFDVPEGGSSVLSMDIEYEIAAPAEVGRLQIWVEDAFGRVTAFNSVPLILLSLGDSDITPPADVLNPIFIQQPIHKALIQGGSLTVSGLARVGGDTMLMARLLTETGAEAGARLVSVSAQPGGGYTPFSVEVPYSVSGPMPALLVVSEGERELSDVIHLSSAEVLLSP
jgi:hypothetical protein